MDTDLGRFEGRKIEASKAALTGSLDELVGKMDVDEEIFIVGKLRVSQVGFGEGKVGDADMFIRKHKLQLIRGAIVDKDAGARMLEEGLQLADERFGVENLLTEISKARGSDEGGEGKKKKRDQ